MLKIKHPGSIVREREKKVSNWETVRTTKYSNGVECQVLIGFLPHGNVQSAISANRAFTIEKEEGSKDATLVFGDEEATIVNFLDGDRLTGENLNVRVLDPCLFLPTADAALVHDGQAGETSADGHNTVITWADGTTVTVHPHGHHAHIEPTRDGKLVRTFFNGDENKLYVFGVDD
jgi:hypothetical protein